MNDTRINELKPDKIYIDFYEKDKGFLSAYSASLDYLFDHECEEDDRIVAKILKDIRELDLSKVQKFI